MKHMLVATAVLVAIVFSASAGAQIQILDMEVDDDDALWDFAGCYIAHDVTFWIEDNFEPGLQTGSGAGYGPDYRATGEEWGNCVGSGG